MTAPTAPVWHRASSETFAGTGALRACLATLPASASFVVDTAVASRVACLGVAGGAAPIAVVDRSPTLDDVRRLAEIVDRLPADAPVVAVGGGATLDLAKLAVGLAAAPVTEVMIRRRSQVSGFCAVGDAAPDQRPLVAVPTTIGTGSEGNAVACVDVAPGERSLVQGPALRPTMAVLDADLTETLGETQVRAGGIEAVLRVLGPLVGAESAVAGADADAHAQLLQLDGVLRRGAMGRDERSVLARLSGATHASPALSGRGRFPSPLWYVANELSMMAGCSKVEASLRLLGPWFERVAVDPVWGAARRMRPALELLEVDAGRPGDGVRHLTERWGWSHDRRELGVAPEAVAARALRRWGSGLPMLGQLGSDDLVPWVRDAARVAR